MEARPEWDGVLMACQKGDTKALSRLLEKYPSSWSHANPLGQSALHIAAWWHHSDCLRILLDHGANPRVTNARGATPLHECLFSRKEGRIIECTKLLQDAFDCEDNEGRRPLDCFSTEKEEYSAIEAVLKRAEAISKSWRTRLKTALLSGDELDGIWSQVTASQEEKEGFLASEWISQVETVCSEETISPDQEHAMVWMWEKAHEKIPKSEGNRCLGLLGKAIFDRYEQVYRQTRSSFVLQEDSSLAIWTRMAKTLAISGFRLEDNQPLHQTWMTIARKSYLEVANLWWEQLGISPLGVINFQGMTALQFAARSGNLSMTKWLLDHAAVHPEKLSEWIQHKDQRGQTALLAAISNDQESIANLLQDYTN